MIQLRNRRTRLVHWITIACEGNFERPAASCGASRATREEQSPPFSLVLPRVQPALRGPLFQRCYRYLLFSARVRGTTCVHLTVTLTGRSLSARATQYLPRAVHPPRAPRRRGAATLRAHRYGGRGTARGRYRVNARDRSLRPGGMSKVAVWSKSRRIERTALSRRFRHHECVIKWR